MNIQVSTDSPEPVYRQIVRQVRLSIALGRLSPGDTLPSVRRLAQQLVVNPNTVARAYAQLERQGVVQTQRRVGTFVAERADRARSSERRLILAERLDALLTEGVHLGLCLADVMALVRERAKSFDFPGKPPEEGE